MAIVIAENFACNLEKILDKTQIKTVLITGLGELAKLPPETQAALKKAVPPHNVKSVCNVVEACEQGKDLKYPLHKGWASDVIALQYTGGTTGVSKGTMITN